MSQRRRPKRAFLALVVLASLTFAQAAVALALCPMERGGLAQMADCVCETAPGLGGLGMNGCVAHCTSDLQQAGFAVGLAADRDASSCVALVVSLAEPPGLRDRGLDSPPPGAPPRRILLHSFLI